MSDDTEDRPASNRDPDEPTPGDSPSLGNDDSSEVEITLPPTDDVVASQPLAHISDPLLGTEIGGVTIVRLIGEGGMGCVYEGRQKRPRRTVAVKVIKPGLTSEKHLRRFEYETQILARLRHPGIAQIYAVGTHEVQTQTVPYFVMEYIPNAKHLTDYANDLKLSTTERLRLFEKVCSAVAHGHQKGIIHRDIKPGNVLVDSAGQPKVIDFGVARSTDSDLALTTMQTDVGALLGTLQYMSPEQFDADPNDLDVRLDVYALGVILYELLTGKPPYSVKQKAVYEVARMIREEDPTPISSLNKTLRRDVAIIAAKCLEKDRNRRYGSANELGGDVQRYLAGEPITAVPPTFWDGIARLARKHKAAAAAVTAIAVSLVVAVLGISAFAVRAERAREEMEAAVLRAEAARTDAENLVSLLTFDLASELQELGQLNILGTVWKELEQYHLGRAEREARGSESVSTDDLRRRGIFHNNYGFWALETGDIAIAQKQTEKAFAIAQQLINTNPENTLWIKDLASSWQQRGIMAAESSNFTHALDLLTRGHQLFERISETNHTNASNQFLLAESHRKLAIAWMFKLDLEKARQHTADSLKILKAVSPAGQHGEPGQKVLFDTLMLQGRIMNLDQQSGESHKIFSQCRDIALAMTRHDGNNTIWQYNLAAALRSMGDSSCTNLQWKDAEESYRESLAILTGLTEKSPENITWRETQADVLSSLELVSRHVSRDAFHSPRMGEVIHVEGDSEQSRLDVKGRRLTEIANSANNALDGGDTQKAEVLWKDYSRLLQTLREAAPDEVIWMALEPAFHAGLGKVCQRRGNVADARTHYEESLRIIEELSNTSAGDSNLQYLYDMAQIHDRIGSLDKDSGDLASAESHFRKFLDLHAELADLRPNNVSYRRWIAVANQRLGDLAQSRSDLAEAKRHWSQDFTITQELSAENPDDHDLKEDLGWSYERQGQLLEWESNPDGARRAYEKSRKVFEHLVASDPSLIRWREGLRFLSGRLGMLSQRQGDFEAALVWYQKKDEQADILVTLDPTSQQMTHKVRAVCEVSDVLQRGDGNVSLSPSLAQLLSTAGNDLSRVAAIAWEMKRAADDGLLVDPLLLEEVTAVAEQASTDVPEAWNTWHAVAHLLALQSRFEEALKALHTALILCPEANRAEIQSCLTKMEEDRSE